MNDDWCELIGRFVGLSTDQVARHHASQSFTALGGTSLAGAEMTAVAQRQFGVQVDLGRLLGPEPVASAVDAAEPASAARRAADVSQPVRPPIAGQATMFAAEEMFGGSAYHLMFSGSTTGTLDRDRLRRAIDTVAARCEALRTSFTRLPDSSIRRVLHQSWSPPLLEQWLPLLPAGLDPVEAVHQQLAGVSGQLLRPFTSPPVVFVLTDRAAGGGHILTLLIHHAVVDGWSIGLLWRDLLQEYDRPGSSREGVSTPDAILDRGRHADRRAAERARMLSGVPLTQQLPSRLSRPDRFDPAAARLRFGLPPRLREEIQGLARSVGVTKTAALLGAWSLVVARRLDVSEFLLGVPVANRPTADLMDAVVLCTRVVPVRCVIPSSGTVAGHVRDCAAALAAALSFSDVSMERLAQEFRTGGDLSRSPVVQVAFAAHDDLVPEAVSAGDLTVYITEGHCGGTAFDALLYLQRWGPEPVFALEYSLGALAPDEAAALAEAFVATLEAMAAEPASPIAGVRAMSERQSALARRWGEGATVTSLPGLWQLFSDQVNANPTAPAVMDDTRVLSYRELETRANGLARRLVEVGVHAGDRVMIGLPAGVDEITAVLAVLRLGAAYIGLDAQAPPMQRDAMLAAATPKAAITATRDGDAMLGPVVVSVEEAGSARLPPPPRPDSDRLAYIAFTSGSTGVPKGVRIAERGVVRLVHAADYLRRGAGEVYLRLAPLAFDASTLEIFAPLSSGACVAAHPDRPPTPTTVHDTVTRHGVTVAWLTAGLFRVIADHRPDTFTGLRHLLTGGDVVPAPQVRAVLAYCPGLRVTNGYGPTENTTFTTVQHFEAAVDVPDVVPIGRPVTGTRLAVLDQHQLPVPPGGVGELYVAGLGLAIDYVGDPTATALAFVNVDGSVMYRTGDLVRWDQGRLQYLGRRDRQVKVAGHRIELSAVEQIVRSHPSVTDVWVGAVGTGSSLRIIAGIVAEPGDGLIGDLRRRVSETQPKYAVPALWARVDTMPLNANGKVDASVLAALATEGDPEPETAAMSGPAPPRPDLEEVLITVWAEVLGHDDFGPDDGFFDIGGTSLQVMAVRNLLNDRLPEHHINVVDLYRHPSVAALAMHLYGARA